MSSVEHLIAAVLDALASDMTIDITTFGRRSGKERRIEIWFLNIDGTIYITGTPGPRDWFANVQKNPALRFHLKESITADLNARAMVVTDADERARVFQATSAQWYLQQGDDLDSLLAEAPMVRVEFEDSPPRGER
jgi:deazaflavin-dependent oxidoreductase (nitroreductase family)